MIQLYINLEKHSCDLCNKLFERPSYTVVHKKTNETADICTDCYEKALKYPKFIDGLKNKEIIVRRR